jgi:hypothetical protein
MKLSGQIDLDERSKSCDRLKISRCFLQGDTAVTRTKNDLSPPPPPAPTLVASHYNINGNTKLLNEKKISYNVIYIKI